MIDFLIRTCGVFFVPQMLISLLTLAAGLGYLVAWARGELKAGCAPWRDTLEHLAAVAVTLGLLGSVVSFCVAFGGFTTEGFDLERITSGLGMAYVTTAVGLVTSLMAGLSSYALGVLVGPAAE